MSFSLQFQFDWSLLLTLTENIWLSLIKNMAFSFIQTSLNGGLVHFWSQRTMKNNIKQSNFKIKSELPSEGIQNFATLKLLLGY